MTQTPLDELTQSQLDSFWIWLEAEVASGSKTLETVPTYIGALFVEADNDLFA